jgi:hypothetical protein
MGRAIRAPCAQGSSYGGGGQPAYDDRGGGGGGQGSYSDRQGGGQGSYGDRGPAYGDRGGSSYGEREREGRGGYGGAATRPLPALPGPAHQRTPTARTRAPPAMPRAAAVLVNPGWLGAAGR